MQETKSWGTGMYQLKKSKSLKLSNLCDRKFPSKAKWGTKGSTWKWYLIGMLLSNEKEWTANTHNMDESHKH